MSCHGAAKCRALNFCGAKCLDTPPQKVLTSNAAIYVMRVNIKKGRQINNETPFFVIIISFIESVFYKLITRFVRKYSLVKSPKNSNHLNFLGEETWPLSLAQLQFIQSRVTLLF